MDSGASSHMSTTDGVLLVRPGAAGLFIGVEYSRVRDSVWMYLTFLVTTRMVVGLVDVHENISTPKIIQTTTQDT